MHFRMLTANCHSNMHIIKSVRIKCVSMKYLLISDMPVLIRIVKYQQLLTITATPLHSDYKSSADDICIR